jgi:hypothetical protein
MPDHNVASNANEKHRRVVYYAAMSLDGYNQQRDLGRFRSEAEDQCERVIYGSELGGVQPA